MNNYTPGAQTGSYPYPGDAWRQPAPTEPEPPQHLAIAIIGLILFWPVGLFALLRSTDVQPRYRAGDIEGALDRSRSAKTLSIVAICSGIALTLLAILATVSMVLVGAIGAIGYSEARGSFGGEDFVQPVSEPRGISVELEGSGPSVAWISTESDDFYIEFGEPVTQRFTVQGDGYFEVTVTPQDPEAEVRCSIAVLEGNPAEADVLETPVDESDSTPAYCFFGN